MSPQHEPGPIAKLRLARESKFALTVGVIMGMAAPAVNYITVHCGELVSVEGKAVHVSSWDNPLWLLVLGSFALSSKSVYAWGRSTYGSALCGVFLVLMLEGALLFAPHPALGWGALCFTGLIGAATYGSALALDYRRDMSIVEPVHAPAPEVTPWVEHPAQPVPELAPVHVKAIEPEPALLPAPVELDTGLYGRAVEVARGVEALSANVLRQTLHVRHDVAAGLIDRLTAEGVIAASTNAKGQRPVLLSA